MAAATLEANAADFGSLHAFLDVGDDYTALPPSRRPPKETTLAAPGVPMPVRPHRDGLKDGTVLNRKVAFKMLKQLGCQVCKPCAPAADPAEGNGAIEGEPFIEVTHAEQPVLFQMLLDWGYRPLQNAHGLQVVRVTDERKQRSQEEAMSALSAPRPPALPRLSEGDGWPTTGARPRMAPEQEQEMIKRLAGPRPPKPAPDTGLPAQAAPKFRTASEQKAHLERLLKPRDPAALAEPEAADQAAGRGAPCGGLPPRPRAHVTWPQTSAFERRVPRGAAGPREAEPAATAAAGARGRPVQAGSGGGGSSSSSLPVRPSPRLAQAGASALGLSLRSAEPEVASASSHRQPLSASKLPLDTPDLGVEVQSAEVTPGDAAEAGKDKTDWLDKLMGPTSWPGRPVATRTRAEQQERLERLARPRAQSEPPPPAEAAKAAPPRSPRSQREACSRLAVPRKKPAAREAEAGAAPDERLDERDAENAAWAAEAEEGLWAAEAEAAVGAADHGDGQRVVVIPSLLTQMTGQLEPIAEDAPEPKPSKKLGACKSRRKARSQSVPSIAAPYAVPVVPPQRARATGGGGGAPAGKGPGSCPYGARGPGSPSAHHDPMEDDLGSFIAQALGTEDSSNLEGEALLATIDHLYNSVLSAHRSGATQGLGASSWAAGHSSSAHLSGSNVPGRAVLQQSSAGSGYPSWEQDLQGWESQADCRRVGGRPGDTGGGGEALLADIDRLYCEMLQGGLTAPAPTLHTSAMQGMTPAAATGAPPPVPSGTVPLHASGERLQSGGELPAAAAPETASELSSACSIEVREVLAEVLWSALLMGRGTGGRIDMQARLLELLPSGTLARCVQASGSHALPPSLLQRLQAELPKVHAAISQPCCGGVAWTTSELVETLRGARDGLLALASSEVSPDDLAAAPGSADHAGSFSASTLPCGPDAAVTQSADSAVSSLCTSANLQGLRPKKSKPRRTSLSYWTPESLDALEPPKHWGSKQLKS